VANVYDLLKQGTTGTPGLNNVDTLPAEDNNEVSTMASIFAGIGSGLIDIPKGLFSLGASIYDLTNDTNKAAEIEKYFDDLTNLDELAEATAAGKITKLLTNVGLPGGVAFKAGTSLAGKAVQAKKAGNYFKVTGANGKALKDVASKADLLNRKGKTTKFIGGATAGGLAEGVFVGDVEEAGTFGDLFGGPTELERDDEYDPERELINRVKFGTEGALFTGLIGGVGSTLKALSTRGKDMRFSNSKLDRFYDKVASKVRARGGKTQEFFDIERGQVGARSADVNFAQQVSRQLDKNIDAIFPAFKTVTNKLVAKDRNNLLRSLNEAMLSGSPKVDEKTGRVIFGKIDEAKKKVVDELLNKASAKPEIRKAIYNNLDSIRTGWGDMFSALGGKISKDKNAFKEFKQLFGKKFQDYLGSTYDIFSNRSVLPFLSYKPTEEAVQKAITLFKDVARQNGKTITDGQAEYYVNRLVKTATLPKGFKMDKASDVVFKLPDFFVGKTVLDDAVSGKGYANMVNLPKEAQSVIKELLGEQKNPMQTILAGTSRLSLVTRRNEFFDDLVKQSDADKAAGKRGMFYETEAEAFDALGPNIRRINVDPNKALEAGITNPINGKYAIDEIADALEETNNAYKKKGTGQQIYEGLLLYPKATSQIAKTILSPVTHARNFVSAGAFATANGIIPSPTAIKDAYQALQTGLKGTRKQNDLYRKLLKLGVVNSNVRLGDLRGLLEDIDYGATVTSDKALRGLLKPLSKLKSVSQDLYTAEDDFWKIISWAGEKSRLGKAYAAKGITRTADQLEEEAASIVRNNIPNYDYVGDFIKGLRRFPVGNFVSFPAEIIRTSTNIVRRGLDEVFTTMKNDKGETVRPLYKIGMQRLLGMGVTTAAVPYATVEMAKALHNVTQDEIDAMRRYVADWSKNSTLIPLRDKDNKLKYIDFSHANAYDTIARPVQTVVNAIQAGEQDKDGIMDDFLKGVITSTKELGEPFISESIWSEALFDLFLRDGKKRGGGRVWNEDATPGTKMSKGIGHLIEAQMPFSAKQLERLGLAFKNKAEPVGVVTKGKFDDYGETYELGNEALGFIGARAIPVKPEKTFKYKIAEYQRGVSNSRQLFTTEVLKGGPITPEAIVDAYINANRALFQNTRDFYRDIKAAGTLGMSEDDVVEQATQRVGRRGYGAISEGVFRPLNISKDVQEAFEKNAQKLGLPNPFEQAADIIAEIKEKLIEVPLTEEGIPEIINPFANLSEPNLGPVGQLPPVVTGANPSVVAANQRLIPGNFNNLTQTEKYEILFGNN
tara:strand:+ start:1394 stop:5263 length:3870 start_codon:yes stop_codon:yes gene_type:complete